MDTKTAQVWTVTQGDKHYAALSKRASAGHTTVKLQDGVTYSLTKDQHKNFVLIAQDSSKIKKESQTVTPNKVDSLVDDPDINQGDGAGKGKTHEDKTHSLAIDEKKPSEGMSEPSVPEAPNDGRLSREHTVDKPKDGPQIPAGGGMHSEYDQNEKNTPEKLDQMLGKHNDVAMASHDDAVKIAGQMVKANLISIDELPNQVRILEQATPDVRKNYETMILKANSTKGMTKAASTDSVENVSIVQKTPGNDDSNGNLKDKIQGLFRLERRNQDFQKYAQEQGDARLWH